MPFYGAAILCTDDPACALDPADDLAPVVSYGFGEDAQVRAVDMQARRRPDALHRAAPQRRDAADLEVTLNLPGSTTCSTRWRPSPVATELKRADDAPIVKALAEFKGVGRRFQRYGGDLPARSGGAFTLIDDYGHHPVEMAAVLAAARGAFPGRRLVLAFQPHRYTRTRDCFEDFVKVMGSADAVLLAEVYAAGEAPIVAADGRSLARAVRVAGARSTRCSSTTSPPCRRPSPRAKAATWSSAWAPARWAAWPGKTTIGAGASGWKLQEACVMNALMSTPSASARSPC